MKDYYVIILYWDGQDVKQHIIDICGYDKEFVHHNLCVKFIIINPRRACAAGVTVLVPYVCQYVCLSVTMFSASTRNEGQNSDTRRFVAATASF